MSSATDFRALKYSLTQEATTALQEPLWVSQGCWFFKPVYYGFPQQVLTAQGILMPAGLNNARF